MLNTLLFLRNTLSIIVFPQLMPRLVHHTVYWLPSINRETVHVHSCWHVTIHAYICHTIIVGAPNHVYYMNYALLDQAMNSYANKVLVHMYMYIE